MDEQVVGPYEKVWMAHGITGVLVMLKKLVELGEIRTLDEALTLLDHVVDVSREDLAEELGMGDGAVATWDQIDATYAETARESFGEAS